ncbi:MAG: DNA helicase RecQ [Spartobacteria bacterium]|nr:DNA helicase RecQ [Spartobacteria bacterium]
MNTTLTARQILKQTFGYDTFRPLQHKVIENILSQRDTLAIMPTGGGKSLCYQIPALIFDGLTVVVSPLIALMKDQVEQMRAAGVSALFLNSTLSPQEYNANMAAIRRDEVRLLYVAPETLMMPHLLELLDSVKVACLTIDEAHCISEWGHDFRPEYRQIIEVRRRYPRSVCLALTATATPQVRKDIETSLGFEHSNQFVASFNRENLYIEVMPKKDPAGQTLRFLESRKNESGIIYCFSRKQVETLARYLNGNGYSACPYHAGLNDTVRRENQESFIRDDTQIIVATIAFGMGINKPNVRFVIHYDLPKSIENYYQEIGRAGRDGLPSHCLLLYSYADANKIRYFIREKQGKERQAATEHLNAIVRYAEDERNCRRIPLLKYFGESWGQTTCDNCDNCMGEPPELTDITIPAQKFLSCVIRTGECFGTGYIISVLRGSTARKIIQNEHEKLPTHGIGKDLTEDQWTVLARGLLHSGYLKKEGEYPTLHVTDKARLALSRRTPIMGILQEPEELVATKSKQRTDIEYNHDLFELLRKTRKTLADEAGVPPYVVFSDRTLVEMSAYLPQSLDALINISGVGQVKLQQYGELFLAHICQFCKDNQLVEKSKPTIRERSRATPRWMAIGQAYNNGSSIRDLRAISGVKEATILKHLADFAMAGNPLRLGDDLTVDGLSPEDETAIMDAFSELGTLALRPIFDRMNEKIPYETLHMMRLRYLCKKNSNP